MPRLTSEMLVSALVRRVANSGGNAAVLTRGDATAGAVLLVCAERGVVVKVLERVLSPRGAYHWQPVGPDDSAARDAWLTRRRARDPDLWVVELDSPDATRFAVETSGEG